MIPRQHAGLPHRHDIVFFERNGLRHGEVTLPFGPKQVQVVEMGWNANSTMLAVWAEALPSEGEGDGGLPPRTWLQVWTMSNYHWYLKQEFTFDGPTHREPMASFAWDVENANRLLMALQCGQLHEYTFYGSVDQTRGLTSVNPAAVAVVDGQQLQLTPFRLAVVPPPMARANAPLRGLADHASVVHATFAPHVEPGAVAKAALPAGYCSPTQIAAQMSDRTMNLLQYDNDEAPPSVLATLDIGAILTDKFGAKHAASCGAARHFTWIRSCKANVWLCVVTGTNDQKDEILEIVCEKGSSAAVEGTGATADVDTATATTTAPSTSTTTTPPPVWKPSSTHWTPVPGRVVSLQPDDGDTTKACAAMCLLDGQVFKYTTVSHQGTTASSDNQPYLVPWMSQSGSNTLPEPCHRMAFVSFKSPQNEYENDYDEDGAMGVSEGSDGSDGSGDEEPGTDDSEGVAAVAAEQAPAKQTYLAALTKHGQLFLSGESIASNCNSFAVHDAYLLYATTSHTCRFLDTSLTFDEAIKSMEADKRYPLDDALRSMERGSRIIAAIPRHTRVVFQMPRGNLESVWPRALVLFAARSLLRSQQYRKAFVLLRRHRVNLNLLYDVNPAQFEADVSRIIDALDTAMHINIMLADMLDEDTTKTMYCEGTLVPLAKPEKIVGKRDRVCELVRAVVLEKMKGDATKAYEKVVVQSYITQTRPQIDDALEYIRGIRDASGDGQGKAEALLKFASVVVKDVNKLYDAALGTYDFDLVVMVALVAQKDPKEYLPFLDEMSKLPEPLKRYKVDMHLTRYPNAITNLAAAGDEHFVTVLDLTKEHKLYTHTLATYEKIGGAHFNDVRCLAAEYLCGKKDTKEAGLLYCAAGKPEEALEAFKKASDWQWCFTMAAEMEMGADELHTLADYLVVRLDSVSRYTEAADIVDAYMDDVERAVVLRIKAKQWSLALMGARKGKRQDLIQTHLQPAVVADADAFCFGFGNETEDGMLAQFIKHSDRLLVCRKEKAERLLEDEFEERLEQGSDLYSETTSMTGSTRTRSSQKSRSSRSSSKSGKSRSSKMTHRSKRRMDRAKTSLREGGQFEEQALMQHLTGKPVLKI